jgi:hypothetical protein
VANSLFFQTLVKSALSHHRRKAILNIAFLCYVASPEVTVDYHVILTERAGHMG